MTYKARRNGMTLSFLGVLLACATARVTMPAVGQADAPPPNMLSAAEKAAGWKLLFDGKTTRGWRGFQKPSFPEQGWFVEDGCLKVKKLEGARGGDIVTVEQFDNFEFQFEWSAGPRANSGVKYFVIESRSKAIGHEYQILNEAARELQATAALYDLLPARNTTFRPPDQFNQGRILVRGRHVEHWLNGVKVLEYELGSPELKAAIAKSKFKDVPGFGTQIKGHILIQDHGGDACFRNLKIREITEK